MRMIRSFLLIAALTQSAFCAESQARSLCVAPLPEENDHRAAPGLFCDFEKLSVRIDKQQAIPWPLKRSIKIDALDAATRHRVVVFCDGKPQQSFTFSFSEYATSELCLFL